MIELDLPFHGTSAQLLSRVSPREGANPPRTWPKDSRAVSRSLRRAGPGLRQNGWEIEDDDALNKEKVLKWSITPPPPRHDSSDVDEEDDW